MASLLFLAAQAHAALYIGGVSIDRANLDGSLFRTDFIRTNGGSVCAIAVDSSHLYWADSQDNTIGRANLDGTSVESRFITLAQGAMPCGLAVNSRFIYWASIATDTIGRARIDGSEVDESFIPTAEYPCAVAITQTGIYWATDDGEDDGIWRTDIGGINAPEAVIEENAADPCGLAVVGSHLFWVESLEGTIGRANLDGSEALPTFITGGHSPVSLVSQGGHLYWVNATLGLRSIGRADLDGQNVNQAFIGGLKYPYALAADSIQVVSPPPVSPLPPSVFKLGKLRRQRDGSVVFPIDLVGEGWLAARVQGAKVKIQPEGVVGGAVFGTDRRWLKITPTKKRGDGSRCVLRAFRRGAKVKLALELNFTEGGKSPLGMTRPFLIFKRPQVSKDKRWKSRRPVNCLA